MADEIKLPFKIVLTGLDGFDQVKKSLEEQIKIAEKLGRTTAALNFGSKWSTNVPAQGQFDFAKNLYSLRQLSAGSAPSGVDFRALALGGVNTFGRGFGRGMTSSWEASSAKMGSWGSSLRGGSVGANAWMDSITRGLASGNLTTVLTSAFGEALGRLPGVFESGINKALPIIKKGLSAIAGFALAAFTGIANAFKQYVINPLVRFFTTEFRKVIKETNVFMMGSFVATLPELIRNSFKNANAEINKTASLILDAAVKGVILPNHATKLAFEYSKVAETLKGFSGWLDKIAVSSAILGTNSEHVASLSLGWAKAFGLDVSKNAESIAQDMVLMGSAAGGTLSDVEKISTWLMPKFASAAGDARNNLRELNAVAQALSEKNVIAPMQIRDLASVFGKLATPTSELLALMSAYNVEIFDTSTGTGNLNRQTKDLGKEYRELYKDLQDLEKEQVGKSFLDPVYLEKQAELTKKMTDKKSELESLFKVWENSGAALKSPLNVFEQLHTLMEKLGQDSSQWAEFEKTMGVTAGKNVIGLTLESIQRARELIEDTQKSASEIWDPLMKGLQDQPQFLGKLIQSMVQGLRVAIGRALGSAGWSKDLLNMFYKGMKSLYDEIQNPNSNLFKALSNFGKFISDIITKVVVPAFGNLTDIFIGLFSSDPEQQKAAKEKLKVFWSGVFSNMKEVLDPIFKDFKVSLTSGLTDTMTTGFSSVGDAITSGFTFLTTSLAPIAKIAGQAVGEAFVNAIRDQVNSWVLGDDPKVQEKLNNLKIKNPAEALTFPFSKVGAGIDFIGAVPGMFGKTLLSNMVNANQNKASSGVQPLVATAIEKNTDISDEAVKKLEATVTRLKKIEKDLKEIDAENSKRGL